MHFAYETSSLEECGPCSNLRFCYSSSTVLNIHGQAVLLVPCKGTLDRQRTGLWATQGISRNVQHPGSDVSIKATGAPKPGDSDEGAGVW
jgi:hypothetical protein